MAAARLAGLAGAVLGWRPGEFWDATPAELAALLKADTERWGPLIKSIGFTADS